MIGRGEAARLLSYAAVAWLATCAAARADVALIRGTDAPIVRIQIPAQANVTVRTWDRPAVQVEGDPSAYAIDRTINRVPAILPPQLIRVRQTSGPDGQIVLPAETFVISSLPAGIHQRVHVREEVRTPRVL